MGQWLSERLSLKTRCDRSSNWVLVIGRPPSFFSSALWSLLARRGLLPLGGGLELFRRCGRLLSQPRRLTPSGSLIQGLIAPLQLLLRPYNLDGLAPQLQALVTTPAPGALSICLRRKILFR